jgi:AcrR family transcriptional regulator
MTTEAAQNTAGTTGRGAGGGTTAEDGGRRAPRAAAPIGGRRRVPRRVRERVILEVAARTFAERGYHAATMDEIAEAVGVSKQLVYNYVGSKEQLYLACFRQAGRTLQARLDEVADRADPPDVRLWHGILAFFSFVDDHRAAWSILYGPGAARDGGFAGEIARQRAQVATHLARLFAASRAAEGTIPPPRSGAAGDRGDKAAVAASRPAGAAAPQPGGAGAGAPAELPRGLEEIALALVGAGEVLATWWLAHPDVPKEKVALRLMNFAWLGLGDLLHGQAWRPPDTGTRPPA